MGWTNWREIADKYNWHDDLFDSEEPACYELAIAGPRGGDLRIVYIGETANEKARIKTYARSGSHLSRTIDWHLNRGWHLFYRGQKMRSKKAAAAMQNRMLARYVYDWNVLMDRDQ